MGSRPLKGYHWCYRSLLDNAIMILYTLKLELHHFRKKVVLSWVGGWVDCAAGVLYCQMLRVKNINFATEEIVIVIVLF